MYFSSALGVLSVSQRCKVNLRRSRWSAPARSSNAWALANHIAGRCQDLPVVFFTTQEPLQTWRDQYYRTCSSLGLWFNDGGICFGRWWNLILARLCVTSHIILANSVAAARKRERERSGKSYNWSYTAIFCDSYIDLNSSMPNGEQNIWHEAWKCRGLVGEFHYMLPTFKCVDWRWDLEVAPWTIQISYQRQWVLRSSHVFNLSWFPWKLLHPVPPEPPKGAVLPAYRGLLYVGDLSMCAGPIGPWNNWI